MIPQDAAPDSDWSDYLTSVAEIQRRTRLDFFRELDDADEIQIEKHRAERIW
jgi:DNA/RNA endonuclease G (NUC1)